MAWKVKWSVRAIADEKEILGYWIQRNGNKSYSKKLHKLFRESAILLSRRPGIGRSTDVENVRVKIIKDYLMFYEVKSDDIIILVIWDSRRDS